MLKTITENGDRLGGKGDGVQDNESDEEGVDQAPGGIGVTPHLEDVVDLPPPTAPVVGGAHALAFRAVLCVCPGRSAP